MHGVGTIVFEMAVQKREQAVRWDVFAGGDVRRNFVAFSNAVRVRARAS